MQTTASLGVLARACRVFSRFGTAAAHSEPPCEPDPHRPFDMLLASQEGWTVAACDPHADGSACIQLQRLERLLDGRSPVFASDGDAWRHVVARARQGGTPSRSRDGNPAHLCIARPWRSWTATSGA
ncbi:MAG: hypothetical protein JO157_07505 [Acetobacteraceae bacterium]|nr:hypothetical protein [Acetobacteraceae bacterium]